MYAKFGEAICRNSSQFGWEDAIHKKLCASIVSNITKKSKAKEHPLFANKAKEHPSLASSRQDSHLGSSWFNFLRGFPSPSRHSTEYVVSSILSCRQQVILCVNKLYLTSSSILYCAVNKSCARYGTTILAL